MNPFLWCFVGAATGWFGGLLFPAPGLARRVENVVVAIFGAFIGGDFLASFGAGGAAAVRPASIGLAFAGALVMLVLLALLRKAVGPLQPPKLRRKPRP